MATFLFTGLWHGPALGYVIFGVAHGIALLVGAAASALRGAGAAGAPSARWAIWTRRALVFHFFCLTQLFFDRDPARVVEALARTFAGAQP